MRRKALILATSTILALVTAACGSDGPSAPGRAAPAAAASRSWDRTARPRPVASIRDTVVVLRRLLPMRREIVETAVIGPSGGDIRIPQVGALVHFPAGALAVPTTITMKAVAGWQVSYEFEPHGIQFAQPVTITQDLRKTIAVHARSLLPTLEGDYYDDSVGEAYLDPRHLVADVKEHLGGTVNRKAMQLSFDIHHFSGYLVSSGRSVGGAR